MSFPSPEEKFESRAVSLIPIDSWIEFYMNSLTTIVGKFGKWGVTLIGVSRRNNRRLEIKTLHGGRAPYSKLPVAPWNPLRACFSNHFMTRATS